MFVGATAGMVKATLALVRVATALSSAKQSLADSNLTDMTIGKTPSTRSTGFRAELTSPPVWALTSAILRPFAVRMTLPGKL